MLKHEAAELPQSGVGPCLNMTERQIEQIRPSILCVEGFCPSGQRTRLLYSFVNQMVAAAFEIKADALMHNQRGDARTSRARQIAMYLINTSLSQSFVEVAAFYGRDRTTVSHACTVVEELRDIAEFDTRLSELEKTITTVLKLIKTGEEVCNG